MNSERLKGNLDLLLLAVLATGPGYGYAVISTLAELSAGTFDLPEGTVYPALHRLEATGLLASNWDEVAGRRRRVYRLTTAGRSSLAEQARQWREFSDSVTRVVAASPVDSVNLDN
jgi:DNA-binding PadR family transcriptional regulator